MSPGQPSPTIFLNAGLLPGQEWNQLILNRLNDFDVALALTSPNFGESDYIERTEIASLLKDRREKGSYL